MSKVEKMLVPSYYVCGQWKESVLTPVSISNIY